MRLYGITKRYSGALQAFSLGVAQGRKQLVALPGDRPRLETIPASEDWPALNSAEKHRLQRALLHYELACCLTMALHRSVEAENVPDSAPPDFWTLGAGRSFTGPLRSNNPFEKYLCSDEFVEMCVVERFVASTYEKIYGSLCDDFYRSFHAVAREAPGASSAGQVKTVHEWSRDIYGTDFHIAAPREAFWKAELFVHRLSRQGLSYLDVVLGSNNDDRRQLFQIGINLPGYGYFSGFVRYDYQLNFAQDLGSFSSRRRITLSKEASPLVAAYLEESLRIDGYRTNLPCLSGGGILDWVGWAFFDEERRLQTLRLPTVNEVSRINHHEINHLWDRVTRNRCWRNINTLDQAHQDFEPKRGWYLTAEEVRNLPMCWSLSWPQPTLGPRSYDDTIDYQKATGRRFGAHVQIVRENTTMKLPRIVDIFPWGNLGPDTTYVTCTNA